MKTYERRVDGEIVQVAKIKFLGTGRYAFITSLFGEKPYELNMNMPSFDTEKQAHDWITSIGKFKIIA